MKHLFFYCLLLIAVLATKAQTGPLCFGQPSGYSPSPVGSFPITVITADYNGDGKSDLAIANMSSNNVSVLLGTGIGTFSTAVSYATGNSPQTVSSADFDGDGDLDLAAVNYGSNNVSVLLGSGTGTFAAAVNYSVGATPVFVGARDLNGDGKTDLAICYSTSHLAVMLGSGTGTFSAPTSYIVGSAPRGVTPADFNGDGYMDLAVANRFSSNVSILLGSATGTFGTAVNYGTGLYPEAIGSSDFNADGKADLAVSNFNSNNVSVLLGSGTGTFSTAVNYSVGTSPYAISIADYNGDGKTDIATPNFNSNNVSVLLGSGTGTFAAAIHYSTGAAPYKLASADFNSDGKIDLATSHTGLNNVHVLFNSIPQPTITVNNGSICLGQNFTMNPGGAVTYTFSGGSAVVSPTISTSYSVTGTNSAGCISSIPAVCTITVIPTAAPVISVNSGSICSGQSFTINATGAHIYSYQGGSPVVSPSATTTYSVIGTNTLSGCTSNAAFLSVTVNSVPVISVNSGSICYGQSFTITPSGASTYSYPGNSAIVSPGTTTSYPVTGTSNAGCVSPVALSNVIVYPVPVITVNSGSICPGQSFTIIPSGAATYTFISGATVVSPLVNTNYFITGASSAGCVASSIAISSVTIKSLPVISVNSGAVCIGKSFTMVPSGAQTYTYSGGSAVVTPTATASYSVTGTSAGGCISSYPAVSTVTVNPLPTFTISGNYTVCAGLPLAQIANGSALTYTWSNGATGNLVNLTPTATSVYTVTGTDVNHCENSVTRLITVFALPSLTIHASNAGVCPGGSLSLAGAGANTYAWSGGITDNMPFYPATTTTYTLTGTDALGCINTASMSVTVHALPVLATSGTQSILCQGETVILSAGGAATFTWNTEENTQSISVSPTVTTTYSLVGTDSNGCSNSAIITQSVDACLGVTQPAGSSQQLAVYPNPSNGEFVIETGSDLRVTILSSLGQTVLQKELTAGKNNLDLSQYSKGVYFVRLENMDRVVKLIIK